MYEIGERVVYGKSGVCTVKDVGHPGIPGMDEKRVYYTLSPIFASGTIYAPVDTPVPMRPAVTSGEALRLIRQIPAIERSADPGDAENGDFPGYCKTLLDSCDCRDLVRLIVMVYAKREAAVQNQKKLCETDRRYMRDAEELLYGELASALGIGKDDVPGFISREITRMKGN